MTYKIERDTDAESPNSWGDNALFLTGEHRDFSVDAPDGIEVSMMHKFTLYAYIHGGVVLGLDRGVHPFTCPWDSCQVGFVYATKASGEFGDGSFDAVKKAVSVLVETWNQYLSGDIWGFIIEDSDGTHVDSCWGFYGRDHCETEARAALACCLESRENHERMTDLCWAH